MTHSKSPQKLSKKILVWLHIFYFFTAIFLTTLPAQVRAQNATDQQDWITRNQQNVVEEQKRAAEFNAIKKEREREQKDEAQKQRQKLKVLGEPSQCFLVSEVRLNGAHLISPRAQKKLTAPFLQKCFDAELLSQVVAVISNYYQNHGYVTAQVVVPKQNAQSGVLELQIIEGKIEKISLGKNGVVEKMQKLTAFGNIEGGALNISDINQGLYQINRLQSSAAVMKISPGSLDGESVVLIENNRKFPASFTLGHDNLGNEFTGIMRTNFGANLDNLFFLNDSTSLNYSTNLKDSGDLRDIKSFSSSTSIPFGYNTFSFDYSHSEYLGTVAGSASRVKSTGFSSQKKFAIERLLNSSSRFRLLANSNLTIKETANYQDKVKTESSERKLVIGGLGFSLSSYLNDTTNIYLKPSYLRGLKVLNAKQDVKNLTASTPKSQFEVFKLYASILKRITLPKLGTPAVIATEFDSQIGKSSLFGSEQFSVGGYHSVRGFRESYITGDSGYNFRNKIGFNLGSLFASKIAENSFAANLNKFTLEPFYDYGHARLKFNGESGRMSGAGVKTIFNSRHFSASLTYSQALQKSKLISTPVKENKMIYFEVSAGCC
ncbi:MAG: ShlB/FhaC/HecB family hemolysin secretion/activation protein [Rickettsiales bacterium]|nr:ShlB/FhaC/HecB family hemolysin secretion/activation protein [Rickettsiales bacterium]